MKSKYLNLIPLIALLLSLITVGRAQAKGVILKVTITGPGLNNEIELTDEESLSVFQEIEVAGQIARPQSADTQSYFDIRMAIGYDTEIFATSVYHYYPASGEHPGYIYSTVINNGISSPEEGQYFLLSEKTNRAFRNLLADLGASLPNQPNSAWIIPLIWFIACGCFLILAGKIAGLKRSATKVSTAT